MSFGEEVRVHAGVVYPHTIVAMAVVCLYFVPALLYDNLQSLEDLVFVCRCVLPVTDLMCSILLYDNYRRRCGPLHDPGYFASRGMWAVLQLFLPWHVFARRNSLAFALAVSRGVSVLYRVDGTRDLRNVIHAAAISGAALALMGPEQPFWVLCFAIANFYNQVEWGLH